MEPLLRSDEYMAEVCQPPAGADRRHPDPVAQQLHPGFSEPSATSRSQGACMLSSPSSSKCALRLLRRVAVSGAGRPRPRGWRAAACSWSRPGVNAKPATVAQTRSPATARLRSGSSGQPVAGVESRPLRCAHTSNAAVAKGGTEQASPTSVVHRPHPSARDATNVISTYATKMPPWTGPKIRTPTSPASVRYLKYIPVSRPAHETASAVATIRNNCARVRVDTREV